MVPSAQLVMVSAASVILMLAQPSDLARPTKPSPQRHVSCTRSLRQTAMSQLRIRRERSRRTSNPSTQHEPVRRVSPEACPWGLHLQWQGFEESQCRLGSLRRYRAPGNRRLLRRCQRVGEGLAHRRAQRSRLLLNMELPVRSSAVQQRAAHLRIPSRLSTVCVNVCTGHTDVQLVL